MARRRRIYALLKISRILSVCVTRNYENILIEIKNIGFLISNYVIFLNCFSWAGYGGRSITWSLMIFIFQDFRTIIFIFIAILTTYRLMCLPGFRCFLSNSGLYTELRSTSFNLSTKSLDLFPFNHNQVQVLSVPILLLVSSQGLTCKLQIIS